MRVVVRFLVLNLCVMGASVFSAFADGFHIAPHLQNITQDGATVIWETDEPGGTSRSSVTASQ